MSASLTYGPILSADNDGSCVAAVIRSPEDIAVFDKQTLDSWTAEQRSVKIYVGREFYMGQKVRKYRLRFSTAV